jgi:Tol biopolymer transport system component
LQIVDITTGSSTVVLAPDVGRVSGLHWSPNGSKLAYSYTGAIGKPDSDRSSFHIFNVADGTSRALPEGGDVFTWTPDGTEITSINRHPTATDPFATRIINVDAETGDITATILDSPLAGCQLGLVWSPDGAYLAYSGHGFHEGCVVPSGDLGVYTWQAASGTTQHLYSGPATAPRWSDNGQVLAEVLQATASMTPIRTQSHCRVSLPTAAIRRHSPRVCRTAFLIPIPLFRRLGIL